MTYTDIPWLHYAAFELFKDQKSVSLKSYLGSTMIAALYLKDGKTEAQIAEIVGLSRQAVSKIITNATSGKGDKSAQGADKRRKLTEKDRIAISRLLLGGEGQKEAAKRFGVSQAVISRVWSEVRDWLHYAAFEL